MSEQAFFFQRGAARLFGFLHPPRSANGVGFVMSHPFGEEKLWSHRVFVSLARALAAQGYAVLRFDYSGAGDSSGLTCETSLETHLADLDAAIMELERRHPASKRIGLIGLRLGATFAALMAERRASAGKALQGPLLLWDPILDGEAYFQELLRSNLSTQLAVYGKVVETREVLQEKIRGGINVNVDGYEIGRELFGSCARPGLLPAAPVHAGDTLVVQIAANEKINRREDLAALARGYSRGACLTAIEQPFWREIKPFYGRAGSLQSVTFEWLEKVRG